MTSGNPASKPIYASVITAVETIAPDALDLGGFTVPFFPGKIMLEYKDPGARPHVVDYADGPVTWRCEQVRIAIGTSIDDAATFEAGYETVFRLLREGAKPPVTVTEMELQQLEVDAFAQEVAEMIERGGANKGAPITIPASTAIIAMATNFVRNRARRAAAQ